jgi:hypothetical protein
MTTEDPRNRREQPRIARRLPVRFGTEARMCGGIAVDISAGGMRIVAQDSFPIHSMLDVYVQFPGHAVKLRARVMWAGSVSGGGPAMGLNFVSPEPSLTTAYNRWLDEVKQAAADGAAPEDDTTTQETAPAPIPAPATNPSATAQGEGKNAPAAPPATAEPTGPVRRRLESPQGQSYDVLIEPHLLGWRLQILQLPRPSGVQAADHDKTYAEYASAEAAMRAFVRAH